VAIDVCRILCKTVDELKVTDIARHALDALAESKIEEVHMIGRRGPVQAAFTPVEMREFSELVDCDTIIHPEDLRVNEASQKELADPRNTRCKKNFEIMTEFAARKPSGKRRKFYLHFLKSPVEIFGDGNAERVVLEKNALSGDAGRQKAKGTGQKEELACGIFFRSVGYRGLPVEGVPFQEQEGVIPNQGGRVLSGDQIVPGLYAAGWIKRGPSGVIGTNKSDSEETVKNFLSDVDQLVPCRQPDGSALREWLHKKGVRVVTFDDWRRIDAEEIKRGARYGKPREKYISVPEMLACL
jgi:ferredoxin--NADP+ reductase